MHSGTAATTAVAIFIARMALRTSSRGVLRLLVWFALSRVAALRVGRDLMLEVGLGTVQPRFVHTNFELARPRHRHAAAAVIVLVEGVQVVPVVVLSAVGGFDQRVDYDNQQDQNP